jgi:hypothetical protein
MLRRKARQVLGLRGALTSHRDVKLRSSGAHHKLRNLAKSVTVE